MSSLGLASGKTVLLATDRSRSVLAESTPGAINRIGYSPYGSPTANRPPQSHLGFNGEFRERPQGWYHLGNGHRVFNPVLMRFHSPDRLSPFAEGGLNPYAYCLGDPLNYVDPTGRAPSWEHIMTGVTIGIGLVLGVKSLMLPMLAKMAKKKSIVWLTDYFAGKPPILGSALGGLDRINALIGIGGAPLGFAGVGLGSNEQPSEGMKALSTTLMTAGLVLGAQQIVGRAIVQLYPVLPKSERLARGARWIHGRHKIEAANKGVLREDLADAHLGGDASRGTLERLPVPPYNSRHPSPSPVPEVPRHTLFNRNITIRRARRGNN
ncbi:RHS repeat-associated core domain-containing protein [Pseudomonas sp. Marseille-P9899]|uniref:RHS repeat-associated core domain-containing protein n=1 Tax=Pseudomonas sp. Marseille-P9899 TaxID=2730401 RepID=UPI00158CFEB8|nr:RHS repeat-associated core domain-containing protein [Pseudomonas sp. Marseille-P9899]